MFFGTTPSIISQWLMQEIKRVKPSRVIVPFSGNFVIEQVAQLGHKDAVVTSTDISLYSMGIGFGICDKPFNCKLNEDVAKMFPFIKTDTPIDLAAAIVFLAEVATFFKKAKKVEYYRSLTKDAVTHHEKYLSGIKAKLEAFKEACQFDFLGVDGCELVANAKKGDLVFYDPPVLLGDYEKMFAPLEECFTFDKPSYTEMNDEVKSRHLVELAERGCIVYYRTNDRIPEMQGYRQVYEYSYKVGKAYCIYSNNSDASLWSAARPILRETQPKYKLIGFSDVITEKSKVIINVLNGYIANHYRLLFVKKAEMTRGGVPFGVFIDGKLIGILQLNSGIAFKQTSIVIFSDPAVPFSKYKRLSKLLVYLCCTKELMLVMDELFLWTHNKVGTVAYSNADVSMKYRDMFELTHRKKAEDTSHFRNKLYYENKEKIFDTYSDALAAWVKKHSNQQHKNEYEL